MRKPLAVLLILQQLAGEKAANRDRSGDDLARGDTTPRSAQHEDGGRHSAWPSPIYCNICNNGTGATYECSSSQNREAEGWLVSAGGSGAPGRIAALLLSVGAWVAASAR